MLRSSDVVSLHNNSQFQTLRNIMFLQQQQTQQQVRHPRECLSSHTSKQKHRNVPSNGQHPNHDANHHHDHNEFYDHNGMVSHQRQSVLLNSSPCNGSFSKRPEFTFTSVTTRGYGGARDEVLQSTINVSSKRWRQRLLVSSTGDISAWDNNIETCPQPGDVISCRRRKTLNLLTRRGLPHVPRTKIGDTPGQRRRREASHHTAVHDKWTQMQQEHQCRGGPKYYPAVDGYK